MQDTTITQNPAPASGPRRRRWAWTTAALVVLAAVAVVIGTLASSASSARSEVARNKAAIASLHGQVSSLNGRVSSLNGQVSSLNGQVSAAQQQVQSAQAAAKAKAAQDYASRKAQLDQREAAVKKQESAIAAEAGQQHASEISADGVYVVGQDIQPGTWHTAGDGGQGNCNYALLNSTNTDDIIDNNNFNGPDTVTVTSAKALEINGDCTWARTGA
jgi:TolA-binding protein